MKKIAIVFALLLAFTATTSVVSVAKDKPVSTWTGTLVDKHCGHHMEADKLASHEKACVMKCAKNGKDLGVSVDGTWYSFDKKGEKLGWNILKGSTEDANIHVAITGKMKGHKIHVTSMQKV